MKAVLAYSGGLDTSVCVKLLQEEYGYDVVTVIVDVGLEKEEIKEAEEKAKSLGAKHYTIDAKNEFCDYIFRAIKANATYEGYPLSTALARPLIASKVVEIAKKEKAHALAHGCTGKGNDQFRFEAIFRSLAPELKIIAPIREMNFTRKESMEYAKKKGIPIEVTVEKPYSIDSNLWGRSIEGGVLEDPSIAPPEEIFELTKITRKKPEVIKITFEKGIPIKLNDKELGKVELITILNTIAGAHGVGRIDIIEDRILGIKSREVYECPAAQVLLTAHKSLEQLVLTRETIKFKEIVEAKWSELVYRGLWKEPLKEALDEFIDKTQERVCGEVKVELYNKNARVVSRESPFSLYSKEIISYDKKAAESKEIEGLLKYHSLQASLYYRKKEDEIGKPE